MQEELVVLVLAVLAGRPAPLPSDSQLPVAADLLRLHRLAGLGYAWARGRGSDGQELATELEPTYRRQQLAGAIVQESAGRALDVLAAKRIPRLLFKGAALARSGAYTDLGARPMDDADVLVPPEDAERAVHALEAAGFVPWQPWTEGRAHWSDAFTFADPAAPSAFPTTIDLHWRTEYGRLRFGAGTSVLWDQCDSALGLPSAEAHLLVVAEHFLKHLRVRPHLLAYADLVRLSTQIESWERFVGLARGRWWSAAIGLLLSVLRQDLGAPVPEEATDRLIAGRPTVRRQTAHLTPAAHVGRPVSPGGRVQGVADRWHLGPGVAGVMKDLWSAAFPPTEWLQARYGGGSDWSLRLRHGQAVLRWASGTGKSPLSPNQGSLREAPDPLGSQPGSEGPRPVDTSGGQL